MANIPRPYPENREIEKNPGTPRLSPPLIRELTSLCFLERSEKVSDVLFVFGSDIMQEKVAGILCGLLREGISRKVIITGGIADYGTGPAGKVAESHQIRSLIPSGQFRHIQFVLETISKNTLENVSQAQHVYDFSQDHSILFLAHSYASRRCSLTLKTIFPDKEITACPYDIIFNHLKHPVSRTTWWKTAMGRSLVWGEYLRLLKYGERGDISIREVGSRLARIRKLAPRETLPS